MVCETSQTDADLCTEVAAAKKMSVVEKLNVERPERECAAEAGKS